MRISRAQFQLIAEEALREVPKEFRDLLVGVEIAVQDYPGPEAEEEEGSEELLGLYVGPDRAELLSTQAPLEPARVLLYQRNLEAECETKAELAKEIRLTLRHELAHYFGLSDEELHERWPEGC